MSPLALLDHLSIGRLEFEATAWYKILVKIFNRDGVETGVCRGGYLYVMLEEEVEGLGGEEVVIGVGILDLVG